MLNHTYLKFKPKREFRQQHLRELWVSPISNSLHCMSVYSYMTNAAQRATLWEMWEVKRGGQAEGLRDGQCRRW